MANVKSITPNEPANFTPEMGNYKALQPFRYWFQKVLPLVYDDSLSYYELLCKVVDYLNKTMEDVETLHGDVTNLHTAYEELQSYVNNYFSTLDVQVEINNKLDNMAESGELYEIIRSYTDPIINEQNEKIDNSINEQNKKINVLETRMNTFTSLPAGSTSGDAELQDIRVGYNGVVYPNAGDAVREQVSKLYDDVDNLQYMKNPVPYRFWESGSYAPDDIQNIPKKTDNDERVRTLTISKFCHFIVCKNGYFLIPIRFPSSKSNDKYGYEYIYFDENGIPSNMSHKMTFFDCTKIPDNDRLAVMIGAYPNKKLYPDFANTYVSFYYDDIENCLTLDDFNIDYNNAIISNDGDKLDVKQLNRSFKTCTLCSTDFIDVSEYLKMEVRLPIWRNKTTMGLACYDSNKNFIFGIPLSYIDSDLPDYTLSEIKHVGLNNVSFIRATLLIPESSSKKYYIKLFKEELQHRNIVKIAASDSNEIDKEIADFVCTGINDEDIINKGVNLVENGGTVKLFNGTYNIDKISDFGDGAYNTAIIIGDGQNQKIVTLEGMSMTTPKISSYSQLYGGAILNVTERCYNNLSDDEIVCIIRGGAKNGIRKFLAVNFTLNNIGIKVPDNQKPIHCIDGFCATSMSLNNIRINAVKDSNNLKMPVEHMIGVNGLDGSNAGVGNTWKSIFVYGCYYGFNVCGEHLVGIDLATRYCKHGFAFNMISNTQGTYTHPITLINCADELSFNMPIFGHNGEHSQTDSLGGRQSINLIDFNMEWLEDYYNKFEGQGQYAQELTPGETYGTITYTIQPSYSGNSKNAISFPFWKTGHGINMLTRNVAHKFIGTTEDRKLYNPNINQQYYDTTLNKMITFNGNNWVDYNGNIVD